MSDGATLMAQPSLFAGPRANPDGFWAAIMLAFLTTAGLFYVNIMPAIVSGLVDGMGASPDRAGYVGAANMYGSAVGALAAVFAASRLPWRKAAFVALILMIGIDGLSALQTSVPPLIAIRACHGLVGGFLIGVGFTVIARTASPDRSFGMLLVVQYGLGGLGLRFLPGLVQSGGTAVLFQTLIAFSLVTLVMLPFLAPYPPRAKPIEGEVAAPGVPKLPAFLALLAVFLFQGGNMAVMAYVIELGRGKGLELGWISDALSEANWIAILGAVAVYAVGARFGRLKPLMIGLAVTLAGMGLFYRSDIAAFFYAANVVTGLTWAFLIPYLLGQCAAFDAHGQMAALSGFFSKMGLASGPMIAALVVGGSAHYEPILHLAIAALILCAATAILPARLLDRAAASRQGTES